MARAKSKVLTALQTAVVDAVLTGQSVAAVAGTNGTQSMRSATVRAEIARAREEVASLTTLRRLDVIEGIMDGIGVARMMSDGGNVIRGWVEISKILGFAAPEVKKIELSIGHDRLRAKYEVLSDADLLEIIEGESKVIPDGEG